MRAYAAVDASVEIKIDSSAAKSARRRDGRERVARNRRAGSGVQVATPARGRDGDARELSRRARPPYVSGSHGRNLI